MDRPLEIPGIMNPLPRFQSAPRSARPAARTDTTVLLCLMVPAFLVAGVLYLGGATVAALATVGGVFVISVLIAPEIGLYAYCMLQALDQIFLEEQTDVLTPGKLLGPFVILAFLIHGARGRVPMLVGRPFILTMLAFGLFGLLMAPLAIQIPSAVRYSLQIIVQVLMIYAAIHLLSDRQYIARALMFCVLGGVVAAAIMISGGGVSRQFSRATLGDAANPNSTAAALSVALICIPAAWAYTRNWVLRGGLLLAGPIIVVAMMKTGSRAALVAIFGAVVLAGIMAKRAGLMRRMLIPAICAGLAFVTGLYVLQKGILVDKSQERLEALFSGSATGQAGGEQEGRFMIWSAALETFAHQPWGFGFGNTAFALEQHAGFFLDIHSTLLSALVDGGVVSFVLFLWGLWVLFRTMRGIDDPATGIAAAMIIFQVYLSILTHTIHFSKYFWVPVMFALLLAEQDARERWTLQWHAWRARLAAQQANSQAQPPHAPIPSADVAHAPG